MATVAKKKVSKKTEATVDDLSRQAAELFKMIGEHTRVRILDLLNLAPLNVGQICTAVGLKSQPAVSHHLALLRHAGLILPRRDGKNNIYELTDKGRLLANTAANLIGVLSM